tara:strand:+ start:87 stop:671 length:585 start_codon:yes stop_codon:yes gene_type:complete
VSVIKRTLTGNKYVLTERMKKGGTMTDFFKKTLMILMASFFLISPSWGSDSDLDDDDGGAPPIAVMHDGDPLDLDQRLLHDAQESTYNLSVWQRKWYWRGRNCYLISGEVMKVTSSILDVVSVISAGIGAVLYGDDIGQTFVIIAGSAEVVSIALDKLGSRSKKAGRAFEKDLQDLNGSHMHHNNDDNDEIEAV